MKTALKISLMLIACVLSSSCEDWADGPRIDPGIKDYDYEKLSIQAEVLSTALPIKIGEGFEMDLSGEISTCNLANVSSLSIYGCIKNPNYIGGFEIQEGEFELYAESTECTISGSFTGTGFQDEINFEIIATIAVNYGRGQFYAEGGELRLKITGKVPSVNDEYMKYELEIEGTLNRKIQTVN